MSKGKRPRRIFLPPMWLALSLSALGIYGMKLVSAALVSGRWESGLVGAVLLTVSVVGVGTPLAYARMVRKDLRK